MPRKYVTVKQLRMARNKKDVNPTPIPHLSTLENQNVNPDPTPIPHISTLENGNVQCENEPLSHTQTPNIQVVETRDCPSEIESLPVGILKRFVGGKKVLKRVRSEFVGPPEGKRYVVEWNKSGCPIGEGGKHLNKCLATIARRGELWPIDKKWLQMDRLAFDDTWKQLMTQFDLNGHENASEYVFKVINSRWRDWKAHLKTTCFRLYDNDEDRIANKDPRADEVQLRALFKQWESTDSERISLLNRANRSKRIMNHHVGSQSFAQVSHKMHKENGNSPTKFEVLKKAYGKKKDSAANAILEKISDHISNQHFEETEKTQEEIEELAITSVLGNDKADRIRGAGVGAITSKKRRFQKDIQVTTLQNKLADIESKFQSFVDKVSNHMGMDFTISMECENASNSKAGSNSSHLRKV